MFDREGKKVRDNLYVLSNPNNPAVKVPLGNTRSLFALGNYLCCGVDEPYCLQIFNENEENVKRAMGFYGAIFGTRQRFSLIFFSYAYFSFLGMAALGRNKVITVDGKNWVRVWDLAAEGFDAPCLQEFRQHEDQVYCVTWWNGRLYTGDYTGTVRIWG